MFEYQFIGLVNVVVGAGDVQDVRSEDALYIRTVGDLRCILDDLEVLSLHRSVVLYTDLSQFLYYSNILSKCDFRKDLRYCRFYDIHFFSGIELNLLQQGFVVLLSEG